MYIYVCLNDYVHVYIMLCIMYYVLCMLKLHLFPHVVTLCFTYGDDDDLQTGAEDGWLGF